MNRWRTLQSTLHAAPVALRAAVALLAMFGIACHWLITGLAPALDAPAPTGEQTVLDRLRTRFNQGFGTASRLEPLWFDLYWRVFEPAATSSVAIGSDGWLFLRTEGEDDDVHGRRPWTDAEWRGWQDLLEGWCRVATRRDLPLVVVVAPNKSSLLSRHLPQRLDLQPQATRYAQLQARRAELSPPVQAALLDLHEVLRRAGPERCYFATDSHWNFVGAELAAAAIGERLAGLGLPPAGSASLALLSVDVGGGDLARMLGIAAQRRETIDVPPRHADIARIEDLQRRPPPAVDPVAPPVLVIHDSFGMLLRDAFAARYPGAVFRHPPEGGFARLDEATLDRLLAAAPYRALVVEMVERRLSDPPGTRR